MLYTLAQASEHKTYWWDHAEAQNRGTSAPASPTVTSEAVSSPSGPIVDTGSVYAADQPAVASANVGQTAGIGPQPDPDNVFEIVTSVFSRPDTLAHPGELTSSLQSMSAVWAIVFLAAGLVCLLNGYKIYKSVIVVMGLAIGAFVGYYMGKQIQAAYIVAGCLGILFAVGCWPLMKYAVAAFGGLAGAFIGANVWAACAKLVQNPTHAEAMSNNYWVGALIGLLFFGMLAFVVFKLSIVLFTSLSGSTIAVLGAVALLLQVPAWKGPITSGISSHPIIIPLLIMVPTAIGLILQQSRPDPAAEAQKKAKAA